MYHMSEMSDKGWPVSLCRSDSKGGLFFLVSEWGLVNCSSCRVYKPEGQSTPLSYILSDGVSA
jgi:hypothetical protein